MLDGKKVVRVESIEYSARARFSSAEVGARCIGAEAIIFMNLVYRRQGLHCRSSGSQDGLVESKTFVNSLEGRT